MRIDVTVRNFTTPYAGLNHRSRPLAVTKTDLMLASLTIGRTNWRGVLGGGWRRFCEFLGHSLHIAAFVDSSPSGLSLSPLFRDLDQSEMIGVSYRLGMALTHVVAQRELSIPWLSHVDRLVATGAASITPGQNRRGDLAGQDASFRWHVVESKGRSSSPAASVYADAKYQAAQVIAISGSTPATNSACVSNLGASPFDVILDDPPRKREKDEQVTLKIDRLKFFQDYYALAGILLSEEIETRHVSTVPGAPKFLVREIEGTNYLLGVHEEIGAHLKLLKAGKVDWLKQWHESWEVQLPRAPSTLTRTSNVAIASDGYALIHKDFYKKA